MLHHTNQANDRSAWRWLKEHPLDALLVAVPVAAAVWYLGGGKLWVFVASTVAIVPLAGLMGRSTEQLATRLGPTVGGLLNATFGNAAELMLALFALSRGPQFYPLVRASLTGSIIGNVLLVLGMAITFGGMRYKQQRFNRTTAGMSSTLLTLATVGLMMPTLYYYVFAASLPLNPTEQHAIESLSLEIACILAFVYALSLLFSLGTHRGLLQAVADDEPVVVAAKKRPWSRTRALAVLVVATAGAAAMSELLVGSVEAATASLGMSSVFVGVIVLAIIGNAAEHSTAVIMAWRNKMDLAVNIAVGSGIQIALFVAPVLVLVSVAMGQQPPLDLHFTPMEIIAVTISIVVLALICQDGETHWLEGVMLLAVYAILALTFYHLGDLAPADVPVAR